MNEFRRGRDAIRSKIEALEASQSTEEPKEENVYVGEEERPESFTLGCGNGYVITLSSTFSVTPPLEDNQGIIVDYDRGTVEVVTVVSDLDE